MWAISASWPLLFKILFFAVIVWPYALAAIVLGSIVLGYKVTAVDQGPFWLFCLRYFFLLFAIALLWSALLVLLLLIRVDGKFDRFEWKSQHIDNRTKR